MAFDKEKFQNASFSVPKSLLKEFRELAIKNHINQSGYIQECMKNLIEKFKKEE